MMANDGEETENKRKRKRIAIWTFGKASGCQFFKGSSMARKSLKFCKNVAAVWTSFKKLLLIIELELIKFLSHKIRDYFQNSHRKLHKSLQSQSLELVTIGSDCNQCCDQ